MHHLESTLQESSAAKFQEGLLKAIPDFWETVRRAVIIGDMLVLMQVPSGNLVLSKDESRYCAWYWPTFTLS